MTCADALERIDDQVAEIAHLPERDQLEPLIAALVQYAKLTSRQGRWVLMGFAQGNAVKFPLQTKPAQVFQFSGERNV